jgi:hypothetical protein
MKKKWMMIGSAVGISSLVMITTGFSALASSSGYDSYKSALKNMQTAKSFSVQAQVALQDNGVLLTSATGSVKANLANKTDSGTAVVTSNGTVQTINFYKQASNTVLKTSDSDVYLVEQRGNQNSKKPKKQDNQVIPQQAETVIDALVGNLKDYVTSNTKADGSQEISVQLTNAQIPAVVNAIAPILIKQAVTEHADKNEKNLTANDQGDLSFEKDLLTKVPQLTQDIKIDKISLQAVINTSNFIEHQQADVTISGKDASGAAHVVTLHLNADLSGINSTTPDQIDLTGKNIKNVTSEHKGNHSEND